MDLIKTILVYMMMIMSSATQNAPEITPPPPQALITPAPHFTQAPTQVPTPVPTATPSPTPVPYTTLYVNDRGEAVKRLQRRLAELGYLNDKIDGIYGQNTKKAVERFQYYNDLKVDGIAGRATQTALFENPYIVPAPPEITVTMTPAPTMPASVTVPVYYVDENNQLITIRNMTCYGSTVIYANSNYVGSDYTLISSGAVSVNVYNGVASPASVTFRYQKKATPAPTLSTVTIPVYYRTESGVLLYQTTATLTRGRTSYVVASTHLVPSHYQLTGSGTVPVTVTAQGAANPAYVEFYFRSAITPTPSPTAVTGHGVVRVLYVDETGKVLNQVNVACYGNTTIYANDYYVGDGYTLISQGSVGVNMSYGVPYPSYIEFRYRKNATPTPTPTPAPPAYQTVTVYYLTEDGAELTHETRQLPVGQSSPVYPSAGKVPQGYTLISNAPVYVTVYANGYQDPSLISFRYAAPARPTEKPLPATGFITVMLQEQNTNRLIHSYQAQVELNKSNVLYADWGAISADYIPSGYTQLTVHVDQYGVPAYQPVFYFTRKATPAPTQAPTPRPTAIPTAIPTAVPTLPPLPTAVPTAVPTAIPTPVPTAVPTAIPTPVPTAVPTAIPTPVPTAVPTPVPPPADSFPTVGNLQEAGMFVRYTGDDLPLFWYKDDTGRPFVSLWALADVAGWQYQPNTGLESRLNERSVMIAFDGNGISLLSVDGFPLAHTALVWQDNLYVTADFLAALGLQAHVDGDVFVIQYP